jgi:hypothetical protein
VRTSTCWASAERLRYVRHYVATGRCKERYLITLFGILDNLQFPGGAALFMLQVEIASNELCVANS